MLHFIPPLLLPPFSARNLVLLAGAGSAALLITAYGFQVLGYAPCKLCYWQRWPHFVAVFTALLIAATNWRGLLWLGAIAAATTAAIGIYHSGVESGLWLGPQSCTGTQSSLSNLSGATLLSTESVPPLIRCDEIQWSFLGLSMAGWNGVISVFLALFWLQCTQQDRPQKQL